MLPRSPLLRTALALMTCLAGTLTAAPAFADSIVYQKDGNIWLTSPDGSKGYQVTTDGGWDSPSQADDGTIVAAKGTQLVRMDRSGHVIGTPVAAVGGATGTIPGETFKLFGPNDPQVSPDGKRIAYWVTAYTPTSSGDIIYTDYKDLVLVTPSDHFELPRGAWTSSVTTPSWIGSDHLLLGGSGIGSYAFQTWQPGLGDDYLQWWFYNVNAIESDAELSPDGHKLVSVAQTNGALSAQNTLHFFSVPGPAWTQAPYPDTWNTLDDTVPRPPAGDLRCENVRDSDAHSPSWSPASNAIAYDDKDGVWVEQVPGFGDCTALTEKLLAPGGKHPDWGPANVDMAQDPKAQGAAGQPGSSGPGAGGPSAGSPGTAAATTVKVAQRVARGGKLRVQIGLAAPARVKLAVCRKTGSHCVRTSVRRTLMAPAGKTVVRLPLRKLKRGRYVLVTTPAGQASLRSAFRVA